MKKLSRLILWLGVAVFTFALGVGIKATFDWSFPDTEFDHDEKCHSEVSAPALPPPAAVTDLDPAPAAAIVRTEDEQVCDLSATGEYDVIGPSKKGLEGFEAVTIIAERYDEKRDEVVATKPYGNVFWQKREVKLASVNVDGKRIRFISRTRNGVFFSFDGRRVDESFREKDSVSGEIYEQSVDLKGNLVKFQNGKKVAEARVSFEAVCGC